MHTGFHSKSITEAADFKEPLRIAEGFRDICMKNRIARAASWLALCRWTDTFNQRAPNAKPDQHCLLFDQPVKFLRTEQAEDSDLAARKLFT